MLVHSKHLTKKQNLKPIIDESCSFEESQSITIIPESPKSVNYFLEYLQLWKAKLSFMVVVTTIGSYLCIENKLDKKSFWLGLGTFLQAGCANSINQVMEVKLDAMMNRTKQRPLVLNRIGNLHAILQAITVGGLGTWILYDKCHPYTAYLGVLNILIYDFMYTPLKTRHWINTWIGTLNGSLPTLMGCIAAKQEFFNIPSIYLFLSMYLWQIPHFMAICYKCRTDYSNAGYQMLSIQDKNHASIQSIFHSALFFPLFFYMSYKNYTPWWFFLSSSYITYKWMLKPSIEFYKNVDNDNSTESANNLFWGSLKHLSVLFVTQGVAFCWEKVKSYFK